MKKFIVFEGIDYISLGSTEQELTLKEVELLKEKVQIYWDFNKFKIINYIGIIIFKTFSIEILPKSGKESLLNMLITTNFCKIEYTSISKLNIENEDLFEILSYLFSKKLKNEILKGNYKNYISVEEKLHFIKGKINFHKYVKNLSKNINEIPCNYSIFSENNLLNSLFKSAIIKLLKYVKKRETIKNLRLILNIFYEIKEKPLTKYTLQKIIFNRKNKRFYESFILMKNILLGDSSLHFGDNDSFSILFQVNTLFEKYISVLCKRLDSSTILQNSSKSLLKNGTQPILILKPDIYIPNKNTIIDTKWKIFKEIKDIKRDDLYQMYAYLTRHKIERVILLYPLISPFPEGKTIATFTLDETSNQTIEIALVSIEHSKKTIRDLKKILK